MVSTRDLMIPKKQISVQSRRKTPQILRQIRHSPQNLHIMSRLVPLDKYNMKHGNSEKNVN